MTGLLDQLKEAIEATQVIDDNAGNDPAATAAMKIQAFLTGPVPLLIDGYEDKRKLVALNEGAVEALSKSLTQEKGTMAQLSVQYNQVVESMKAQLLKEVNAREELQAELDEIMAKRLKAKKKRATKKKPKKTAKAKKKRAKTRSRRPFAATES